MTPINAGEYKSQVGLDKLHYAKITADDAAAYTPGTNSILGPAIAAKPSTESDSTAQYADDSAFDTSSSVGPTTIDVELTNLPLATVADILGVTYNVTNGMLIEGAGMNPPDVALSFRSKKSNGKYRYFQYLKGKFSMPEEDFATLAAKPEPKPMKIKYTAVNTLHEFTTAAGKNETVKVLKVDEDATGADVTDWFDTVQVPPAVV